MRGEVIAALRVIGAVQRVWQDRSFDSPLKRDRLVAEGIAKELRYVIKVLLFSTGIKEEELLYGDEEDLSEKEISK